jgi:hypothetical protein
VNPTSPADAEEGLRLEMVAALGLMVKVLAVVTVESPFTTVTETDAALAIIACVTGAVSCVPLTLVVVNEVEFQTIAAPEVNPVPFTVNVKAAPPAVADDGLRLPMVAVGAGLMVKVLAVVTVESPLMTVTEADAALAIMAWVTGAVSWIPLTFVVVNCVEFQTTLAPVVYPVPFTVRVKAAPPAVADGGLRLLMVAVGAGWIVKVAAVVTVESPLTTVTDTDAALAIIAWVTGAVS